VLVVHEKFMNANLSSANIVLMIIIMKKLTVFLYGYLASLEAKLLALE
jgi:hypothetical protein